MSELFFPVAVNVTFIGPQGEVPLKFTFTVISVEETTVLMPQVVSQPSHPQVGVEVGVLVGVAVAVSVGIFTSQFEEDVEQTAPVVKLTTSKYMLPLLLGTQS